MQIRASCYLMTERCDSITPVLPEKERKQELKTRDEEEGEGVLISSHRQVTPGRSMAHGPKQRVSERTQDIHRTGSCCFCPLFTTRRSLIFTSRPLFFFLLSVSDGRDFTRGFYSTLFSIASRREGDGHTFPVSLHQPFFTIHSGCYYFLSVQ